MVTIVVPICMLTAAEMISHHQASEYTAHATVMDMDTHVEDLITTMIATDTSETTDTHQAPHVEMVCTCTTMTIAVIAMTTVEDMVTWIVTTTDMVIHVTEIITVTIVVLICMLTAAEMISHHQASEYTAHATVMDMDTHAEDLITTMTATDTSEIMDTHQAPHVEMVCTCTTMTTVVIVMTTVVDMVTWIVETM